MTLQHDMTRRSFVKGAAALAALMPVGALLSACGSQAPTEAAEPEPEADGASADGQAPDQAAERQAPEAAAGSTVLVAYFSATGNTEGVANAIAGHLGADVFAITPAQPYTAEDLNYNDSSSRTSRERADANRSVELEIVAPEAFDSYDTVFVGYPIWWGDASWVVDGFVSGNDFSGKRVIPFCTSASSPLGSSGDNLAALAGTGEWLEGRRFSGGASDAEVAEWVDGLGL